MVSSRSGGGLATRIVRATLIIGAVTMVVASAVALAGTARLTEQEAANRQRSVLLSVENLFEQRLFAADSIVARASLIGAKEADPVRLTESITVLRQGSRGLVSEIHIRDTSGKRIAYSPDEPSASKESLDHAFRSALRGDVGLSLTEPRADGSWDMWITRSYVTPDGDQAVVLARIDTSFVDGAVQSAVGPGTSRATLLLDEGTNVVRARAGVPVDLSHARWALTEGGGGTVSATTTDGGPFTGRYDQIEGVGQRRWRVVFLEPATAALEETLSTVWPALAVLIIGGGVGILTAWSVSNRVVAPLRHLEGAARRVAKGAYVKPIEVTSDDEVGRMADAFNAVALRLNALHDLSQLLASASQLDQVLDGILSAVGHIVESGVAVVYLVDDSGRWLTPVRARGVEAAHGAAVDSQADTWLARVLAGGEPTYLPADGDAPEELPGIAMRPGGALAAPLIAGSDALGVVVILLEGGGELSDAEFEMVRTFSAQAAVAVKTSRLFAIESESRRVAEALRRVADELVRPDGLEDALGRVSVTIKKLFDANEVYFALVDRKALGLQPAEPWSKERDVLRVAHHALASTGGEHAALVYRGDDPVADRLMDATDSAEMLVTPINAGTGHGGVFTVLLGEGGGSSRGLVIAESVADEVALALDNAYLYERALLKASMLEDIFRISQVVGSSLDVSAVLASVLEVVIHIIHADGVVLLGYDERSKGLEVTIARGRVPASVVTDGAALEDPLVWEAFATGELQYRECHEGGGPLVEAAERQGLSSVVAVPLLARGRSIGVLVALASASNAFEFADMTALGTFAGQAALALDTARLYSREHETAHVLKQSIMPADLPDFPRLDAASVYVAAGAEGDIGGDYYDLFRAPDDTVWLAIGDVCGKGVHAATKTSMIKFSVRAFVAAGYSPSSVVSEVNRMATESGDSADIVTLFVGRLSTDIDCLEWASGGHPAGYLRHQDGTQEELGATGPLLGALADVRYDEGRASIAPGDTILLYTDGVSEARQGKKFFSDERIKLSLASGGGAHDVAYRLLADVREFADEQRDDIAILAVAVRDDTPR